MKERQRLLYMDVAKALAMFLVVWGHIIVFNDSEGYEDRVAQGIYSFHTAFFMFLSGCFFANALRKNFKTLLIEKSRQLLLPYLSWSFVSLLLINIPEAGLNNVEEVVHGFILGGGISLLLVFESTVPLYSGYLFTD